MTVYLEGITIQDVGKNRRRITIQSIQDLPTLSTIISKLVEMMDNENSSPKELSDLISKDQSILAAILKLVNSAFYGFPRKITSVHQAVVILGFNTVKSMALGASIFKAKGKGKTQFDRNALWIHSVGVGTAAKIIAQKVGYKDADEAFVAGLMHDVGKVIFDSSFSDDFKLVTEKVEDEAILILDAERSVMGIDHAEAGQILLFKWQLPLPVVNAVGYHHDLEKAPEAYAELAAIVHLADIVCRKLKIGSGGDSRIPKVDRTSMKILKLSTARLEEVLHETEANKETIEMFKIE
ncbi:MAG: HDOD domain-containing protein [Nitrospinae bacterium]|nr:HDOD domain-containing protein [Nitrospinota bacterium]